MFPAFHLLLVHIFIISSYVIRNVSSIHFSLLINTSIHILVLLIQFQLSESLSIAQIELLERPTINLKSVSSVSEVDSNISKYDMPRLANKQIPLGIDAFWDKTSSSSMCKKEGTIQISLNRQEEYHLGYSSRP